MPLADGYLLSNASKKTMLDYLIYPTFEAQVEIISAQHKHMYVSHIRLLNNFYETFPMCEGVTMLSVVSKGIPLISLFEKLKGITNPLGQIKHFSLKAYF